MRTTNFLAKSSSLTAYSPINSVPIIKTFVSSLSDYSGSVNISQIGDFYKLEILTPDFDCFLFIVWNGNAEIVRVGNPSILAICYLKNLNLTTPYKHIDTNGNLLKSGVLTEIGQGFYYINPNSLDNKSFFYIDNKHLITLKLPYPNLDIVGDGSIKLNPNVWQLIAIPVQNEKVYEYFVKQLEDKTGESEENILEVCNCYFGQEDKFRSYVPAVTNRLSSNNFPLSITDGIHSEITAFWVKMRDYTTFYNQDLIFEWG